MVCDLLNILSVLKYICLSLLTLSLAALSACGPKGDFTVNDDCDCGFYTSEGGTKLMHWRDGTRVQFEFDRNFTPSLRPAVKSAALAYNNVLARTNIQLDIQSSNAPLYRGNPDDLTRDGFNGIYLVDEPWPFADGAEAEGMTVVQFDPDGIVEADIYIRLSGVLHQNSLVYPSFSVMPIDLVDAAIGNADNRWARVLNLHEMGHALGLVHSEAPQAVMQPLVGISLSDTGLSAHDIATLRQAYEIRDTRFIAP